MKIVLSDTYLSFSNFLSKGVGNFYGRKIMHIKSKSRDFFEYIYNFIANIFKSKPAESKKIDAVVTPQPENLNVEQVGIVAKRTLIPLREFALAPAFAPFKQEKPVETTVKVKINRKPERLNLQKPQNAPQPDYRWGTIAKVGLFVLGIASAPILLNMLQQSDPVKTGSGLMLSSEPHWSNPMPPDNVWHLFQKPVWAAYSADNYQNTLKGNELQAYQAAGPVVGICEKQEVCSINNAAVLVAPPVFKLDLRSYVNYSNPQKPLSFHRQPLNWQNLTLPLENEPGTNGITTGHGPEDKKPKQAIGTNTTAENPIPNVPGITSLQSSSNLVVKQEVAQKNKWVNSISRIFFVSLANLLYSVFCGNKPNLQGHVQIGNNIGNNEIFNNILNHQGHNYYLRDVGRLDYDQFHQTGLRVYKL